jgi:hypothetical protein
MKFTVKTIMVAAALVMLCAPMQAAELESGFRDTKWASPAKDLNGFTKMKISFYCMPIAKQANAEMIKNLEAEPPWPDFPFYPFSNYGDPLPMMEFMRF